MEKETVLTSGKKNGYFSSQVGYFSLEKKTCLK